MRSTLPALLLLMLSMTPARGDGAMTAAPPAVLDIGEATLLALDLAPRIEAIRGLKFKQVVPVEIVDDATARAHFDARVARYWPEDRLRDEQTVYTQLGILPEGTDLLALLFDVLEEQAGGYYDPERGTLFLLDDMPRSTAPILLAHELTHALDDQHFRIDALLDGAGGGNDRETAVGALVEGSGTIIMMKFTIEAAQSGRISASAIIDLQESEAGQAARLTAAPQYVQRSVVGPYVLGQRFLLQGDLSALSSGFRPQDLDRAFADPPTSTEQILHPEKYWDRSLRDDPREVDLPDLSSRLGKGWSLRSSGVLGELIIAILAGAGPIDPLSSEIDHYTNEAAAGWGGDRWQLYTRDDRIVVLLATLWDSERDAGEFEASLATRPGQRIERRGDAVIVVAGSDEDGPARLVNPAFAALTPDGGRTD